MALAVSLEYFLKSLVILLLLFEPHSEKNKSRIFAYVKTNA